MPQGKRSTIQGELVPTINAVVKPKHIARAFPELRCTFGGRSTVPDMPFLLGTEFRVTKMEKLLTHSLLLQIGLLKFCHLTRVKQK